MDVLGVIVFISFIGVLCFFVWKEMKRAEAYHRKQMIVFDAIHRYCMMCCDEMESDHASQG